MAVMTTANKITIFRILLVPFFIGFAHHYIEEGQEWVRLAAVVTFALAALSDGVDGYIARNYNQRSELGAILDPLADKLLMLSSIILLSLPTNQHFGRIPYWLTITVLSRDAIILLGMVVIHHTVGKVQVRARIVGKVATAMQIGVVIWILLKLDRWDTRPLLGFEISATLFTALSGLLYIWDGVKQLSMHPTSGPRRD
jgi:cardiolipin synthase